ncbi:hypothetical protein Tco_0628922 [Tanacetum coccineum]|uniref:Reverse transcriptase Ty1/copia-type domain-containing protein n=1 Tax=Tanacetum coccineum TaxID=301880 RepID=A0ABQ4WRR1_9ASTR
MEASKPLMKDENAKDVNVNLYRSMIGSLMYLTSSRPDIMFVICACARFQVTPKVSHLHAVKRIFRYLKDRKSRTGAEYVAAASFCGQVLWIQNQMLDYRYNFMNTKIFIDNESTICIVKNPVLHLKTKHIEIRHYFIRDSNEKKLIQMIKIHTYQNVADLLTKAFNVVNDEIQVSDVGLTYYPHKGVKASANSDVMYFFTSAQDGDPSQDDVRLCLGDDLKKAQDHSQRQAGDLP